MSDVVNTNHDAKPRIPLKKIPKDINNQPYYVGKVQWPGTLNLKNGVSFMVFVSEEDVEELQIAPYNKNRRAKKQRNYSNLNSNGGRIRINLRPVKDRNGNTYYVGEIKSAEVINLEDGVFFTVFTSRPGKEELQISRLKTPLKTTSIIPPVSDQEPAAYM